MGGCYMIPESDSNIAWHRVQLKKNRDAVKALDALRRSHARLISLVPVRATLEDYFIQQLREKVEAGR